MGIRDAAFEVLKRQGKQTAREIWAALEAGGFTSAHRDPAHAVQSGLAKRARMQKDVFLVGDGRWDLCKSYSDEERTRIIQALTSQSGRDPRHHRASTVEGMRVAKARGARLGPAKKLSAEQIVKVEEMIRAGLPMTKVGEAFGVTRVTIYNTLGRDRIADLPWTGRNRKAGDTSAERPRVKTVVV